MPKNRATQRKGEKIECSKVPAIISQKERESGRLRLLPKLLESSKAARKQAKRWLWRSWATRSETERSEDRGRWEGSYAQSLREEPSESKITSVPDLPSYVRARTMGEQDEFSAVRSRNSMSLIVLRGTSGQDNGKVVQR